MDPRRLILFSLAAASPGLSAPLRTINSLEYEYRDQQLTSRNPDLDRPDHINVLNGRSALQWELAKFTGQSELGLSSGRSGETSFTTMQAGSQANLRDNHSSDRLEANWLRTHGFDSTQQPLEPTLVDQGAPFTSVRAAYAHTEVLNSFDSISAGVGTSRNQDSSSTLDTRSYELNWARVLSRSLTNSLGLQRSSQLIKTPGSKTISWILQDTQNWLLDSDWTAQTAVGALREQSDTPPVRTSFIMGASVSYTLHNTVPNDAKTGKPKNPGTQDRPDLEQLDATRTQSQFRTGWQRNLNQRRKGDPQFLADQFFILGLWVIDLEQSLQIDLQQLQSIDKADPAVAGLRQNLANLDYRWKHSLGPGSAGLIGVFGLGISQETVLQLPQRTDRQTGRLNYALVF